MTAEHTSFFYTSYAVYLSVQQPERLLTTKWLYPEVAKHYGTTRSSVEQGIHRVAEAAWAGNPELMEQLAHSPLDQPPTASKFIAILAAYFFTDPAA